MTINEATVKGTCQIMDNVYSSQLKKTAAEIGDKAIPCVCDQLSNARMRSAKIVRRNDLTHFGRLDNFQIGFGLFHAVMNYCWAVLNHHRGSINQIGSLTYFFTLLDKARLAGQEPDYHTLLTALNQIFDGIIINVWCAECGFETLEEFAASDPSPETLLQIASQILINHATPWPEPVKLEDPPKHKSASQPHKDSSDNKSNSESESSQDSEGESYSAEIPDSVPPESEDIARRNLILLIRDLLYVMELVRATKDGDFGRIEDILGQMAMLYRGLGCKNYCVEILHYIHNLKRIWGPGFG